MVNRGGIGDLLVGRKMAGLPTVQDVQTYAQGGETTIEMPKSLKELQNWNKTHPDKNLMDQIFTDRRVGVEGAEPIAMPANVDELAAFMKAKRQGYSHGGETKAMAHHLQSMGQDGDTILAHINPEEAGILKALGGSGKPNPHTGLPSFGVNDGPEAGATGSFSAERSAEAASVRGGDTVSGASTGMGNASVGRGSDTYSGPISRFGTDVTVSNMQARQPSTVSPSGNFDIYGGISGGSDLISPAPAPEFISTEWTANPFKGAYISPLMTAARMQQNPASSDFNYKAMDSLNPFFQTKAAALLTKMMDEGLSPYFTSGSRTIAQQADIYGKPSPYGAAPPGASAHNFGQAFDIGGLTNKEMIDAGIMAEAEGMGWGGRFTTYDPVHFQEMPTSVSPAAYAARTSTPLFTGTSATGVNTAQITGARPEALDLSKVFNDRMSNLFTVGGIGSLMVDAAVPPLGAYDMMAGLLNMTGANIPTTSSVINASLGLTPPELPQAPVIPAQTSTGPSTISTSDMYTPAPASGPTTRGTYDALANVEFTSGGPLSRATTPSSMQVADATGTIVPTVETQPAVQQERSFWDSLFNNPETVQKVLETPNPVNPGYPNTTSGLTKEQWAEVISEQTGTYIDPDSVKARITTMNGVPQVDFYTKGMDQVLSEIVTGPFKALGDLLGVDKLIGGVQPTTEQQPVTETPVIPSGGIGDHQTAVARYMLNPPTSEEEAAKNKSIYEIWPTVAEGYTGPYSKYLV